MKNIVFFFYITSILLCLLKNFEIKSEENIQLNQAICENTSLLQNLEEFQLQKQHRFQCENQHYFDTYSSMECQNTENELLNDLDFDSFQNLLIQISNKHEQNFLTILNELQFYVAEFEKDHDIYAIRDKILCQKLYDNTMIELVLSYFQQIQIRLKQYENLIKEFDFSKENFDQNLLLLGDIEFESLENLFEILFQKQENDYKLLLSEIKQTNNNENKLLLSQKLFNCYQIEKINYDVINKFLQISQKRLSGLNQLYNPEPILKDKVALFAKESRIHKQLIKNMILNNKFNFKLYNNENIPIDIEQHIGIYYPYFEYVVDKYQVRSILPDMTQYHFKDKLYQNIVNFDKYNNFTLKSKDIIYPAIKQGINLFKQFLSESEQQLFDLSDSCEEEYKCLFIEKFPLFSLGKGINVIHDIKNYKEQIKDCKFYQQKECHYEQYRKQDRFNEIIQLQHYLLNPLLLDNKKFEFRTFVLIFSTGDNFLYWIQNAYVRRSLFDFSLDSKDKGVHTSHTSMVKRFKENQNQFDEKFKEAQQTLTDFEKQIKNDYQLSENDLKKIYLEQKQVILYALLSAQQTQLHKFKPGMFHLFGCDTMFDDKKKPWLIECNANPQLSYVTQNKEIMIAKIIKHYLNIVTEFQDNFDTMNDLAKNVDKLPQGTMELIYNSATNYNILDQ